MELHCDPGIAAGYKSRSQIARIVSEDWGTRNLYCAACPGDSLTPAAANTRAYDFTCPECSERYQLKCLSKWNDRKVLDSAYAAMMGAIEKDTAPNLLLLHYLPDWRIERLLLIPRFFFSASVIERRKPLSESARRSRWVGCNILIGQVVREGKILIIADGRCRPINEVRKAFGRVNALRTIPPKLRGWALDVLRCVRRLPQEFALTDVYRFESELSSLHPDNRHIRDKIRQQLQLLRDLGLVTFLSPGRYRST